jgi:hypothetical protein
VRERFGSREEEQGGGAGIREEEQGSKRKNRDQGGRTGCRRQEAGIRHVAAWPDGLSTTFRNLLLPYREH